MARPTLPDGEARNRTIRFRVTAYEARQIRRLAGGGRLVSSWIRSTLLGGSVPQERRIEDEEAEYLDLVQGTE